MDRAPAPCLINKAPQEPGAARRQSGRESLPVPFGPFGASNFKQLSTGLMNPGHGVTDIWASY